MTHKIEVGQEAAIYTRHGHKFGWIVTKVTPSGQATVAKPDAPTVTRRFLPTGMECASYQGQSKFHRCHLMTDPMEIAEAKEERARRKQASVVVRAIDEIKEVGGRPSEKWSKESLEALITQYEVKVFAAKRALAEMVS